MSTVDELIAFIESGASADDLAEAVFREDSPEIWQAAVADHGSWEAALATALIYVVRRQSGSMDRSRVSVQVADVDRPERVVGRSAHAPLFVITRSGQILQMSLSELATTRTPLLQDFPQGPGGEHAPERLVLGLDDPGLVIITVQGNAIRLDARLLAKWEFDAFVRPLHHRIGELAEDDVALTVLPTSAMRDADRLYSMSIYAQLKASDMSEYRRLDGSPMQAVLLRDGDALLDVFAGTTRAEIFVASSQGKAIHFGADDLRSQGRRATGVRAMALDPGARVVGSFVSTDQQWVALATEQGLFKRMSLEEFRPQARAGGGLQSCRLNPGDEVASVAPVPLAGDVIAFTSQGRFARFPAFDLPFGGRAAKGDSLLRLDDGEQITQILGVPAGHLD